MSPEERREVLEQLLERVRRNSADRGRTAPPRTNNNNHHAVHAAEEAAPALELAPAEPVAPPAASSRPLVRFEFEDEQTSTGDPDQIEALVLAEAAAAEAAARGDSEEPLSGPSTIPPAAAAGSGGPLELEDLDSLGAPPYASPSQAPPPPDVPRLAPPPQLDSVVPPPAFVTPAPAYEPPPPAFVPPPAYEPPPPAFVSPPAYEPPPPAYMPTPPPPYVAAPPPYVAEPPRYLSEPPPAPEPEGEIAIDDEAVIELDEADLRSVPPEPMPMEAAFVAASHEDAYGDQGPETDHAGFVDRSSLAEIEASVLPPVEPAAELSAVAPPPADVPPLHAEEPVPESQRQKRELDRPIDDVLEGVEEPPPESGEVESQRYPTSTAPIVDEVSAERIAEVELDEAPTPPPLSRGPAEEVATLGSPSIVDRPVPPAAEVAAFSGARPREAASFGELLDRALSLGE